MTDGGEKRRAATIHFPTIRYISRYKGHDTLLCAKELVISNLHYFLIIYFQNNKFNMVITQHEIAFKCRAWGKNVKDSDFPNLLM